MANTIAPVTISTIGGPSKSLFTKWLISETSANTTAPATIIPRPDIWKNVIIKGNLNFAQS